ncbi:GlxA family transcriptional regulator [Agrobacterium rosae]|uniref:GlxA family transcriptional regulator n=1 Tax=Agrobacterium rosae TaxID=1972867 RepID=A0AAW9FED0_9HYPH|nr:GlxA family transcriptional regulator [Agrobacterium rosae]MDX8303709.1 GlxA family transcriptional regulator [Agrobacterium rosae]POO57112.1 AraC family transcriptional regulator [Agrobacterium rosae]
MTTGGRPTKIIPVFVVLPPQTLLLDVAGPLEVLRYANQQQDDIRFDCKYIAASDTQTTTIGLSLAGLQALPQSLPDNAMVVISGGSLVETKQGRSERRVLADWLRKTVRDDTTIVSICSGALIAAEAGVFDGHHCTTHADCMDELRRRAPLAQVLENRLFVEDGRRFSSAGISTGIDLLLHIVSSLTSPVIAARIAQIMVIYIRRTANDPQISPWLSGRNHIHPSVHKAQDAIVADPAAEWSLGQLAKTAGLSERHLSRLFREHTGVSVVDYINLMRVNLARDILAHSRLDMEAVAERSGFASARHLRRVWQQHHEEPPSFYRTLSS